MGGKWLCDNTSFKNAPTESDQAVQASLSLHPNPAKTRVNLEYRYPAYQPGDRFRLRLYGLDGRILQEHELPAGAGLQDYTLPLASLPAGTYLLTWSVNGALQAYRHLVHQ